MKGTVKEVTGWLGVLIPDDGSAEVFFSWYGLRKALKPKKITAGQRLEYALSKHDPRYAISVNLVEAAQS
jgi:cold shock CspA family protein